jgi:hypothetical protein
MGNIRTGDGYEGPMHLYDAWKKAKDKKYVEDIQPKFQSFQKADGTVDPRIAQQDGAAFKQMEGRALSSGPSTWAQLQERRQRMQEQDMIEDGTRQAAGANATAASQLAMRGGISSGARERIAAQGQEAMLGQQQEARRAGMGARLDIGIQDDTARTGLQRDVAGMDVDKQRFNIGQMTGERDKKFDADFRKYAEQMKFFTGEKMAQAYANANSGKKGK